MERSMHNSSLPGRAVGSALCRAAALCVAAAVIAGCGIKPPSGAGAGGGGRVGGGPARAGQTGSGPAVAGSGSAHKAQHSGSANPSPDSSSAAATCLPSAIRVTLDIQAAGVAAGSSFVPLDFTNSSQATCQLTGYPVITLTNKSGQQLGTEATADRSLATEPVVLAAGQTAHIWLHLLDVVNLPAAQCDPATAAGLNVGLPGQSPATFIGYPVTTCTKQVHGTEILTVEPFRPGRAEAGTAQ